MSAYIEKSIYVGITQTKFDLYDNVKLILNSGDIVEGQITWLGDGHVCLEDICGEKHFVSMREIDDYSK